MSHEDERAALLNKKANQASRRKIKTRAASRRGFGYFYQANNYARNFKVDFDKFDKINQQSDNANEEAGQNQFSDKQLFVPSSLQQLNQDYKKFIADSREIRMWNAYEKAWKSFTEYVHSDSLNEQYGATSVPFPINNTNFIFHIRRICNLSTDDPNNADLWVKVKREALRRYHPDKFSKYLSRLTSDDEKQRVIEDVNKVAQLINSRFQF